MSLQPPRSGIGVLVGFGLPGLPELFQEWATLRDNPPLTTNTFHGVLNNSGEGSGEGITYRSHVRQSVGFPRSGERSYRCYLSAAA